MRVARKFVLAFLLLSGAVKTPPLFAQGCAMCKANAKATPKDAQRAINRAILVMLVPPLGAITFGVAFVIRYSRQRDEENERNS